MLWDLKKLLKQITDRAKFVIEGNPRADGATRPVTYTSSQIPCLNLSHNPIGNRGVEYLAKYLHDSFLTASINKPIYDLIKTPYKREEVERLKEEILRQNQGVSGYRGSNWSGVAYIRHLVLWGVGASTEAVNKVKESITFGLDLYNQKKLTNFLTLCAVENERIYYQEGRGSWIKGAWGIDIDEAYGGKWG